MKIIFFPVTTTAAKLAKITQTAHLHFTRSDPLLFLVPDETAWKFLNELLWTMPPESFLPHPSKLIHIRLQLDPEVLSVFNLCPSAPPHDKLKTIYELEDYTSNEKKLLSEKRYQGYKALGLPIETSS
jgi:DNA polymerase IIIc chi subunit